MDHLVESVIHGFDLIHLSVMHLKVPSPYGLTRRYNTKLLIHPSSCPENSFYILDHYVA